MDIKRMIFLLGFSIKKKFDHFLVQIYNKMVMFSLMSVKDICCPLKSSLNFSTLKNKFFCIVWGIYFRSDISFKLWPWKKRVSTPMRNVLNFRKITEIPINLWAFGGLRKCMSFSDRKWVEEGWDARVCRACESPGEIWLWGSPNCKFRAIDPDFTFGKADWEKSQNLAVVFNKESLMILWLWATEVTLVTEMIKSNSLRGIPDISKIQEIPKTQTSERTGTRTALVIQVLIEIQTKEWNSTCYFPSLHFFFWDSSLS